MEYLGLIGNVESSILDVEFGDGFQTEQMKLTDFATICEKEFGISDVMEKLDHEWGYCAQNESERPQHVYVVKKFLTDFPQPETQLKDIDHWRQQQQLEAAYEEKVSAYVENKTRILRLLTRGSIQLSCEIFYDTMSDGSRELIAAREQTQTCENRLFKIHEKELEQFSTIDSNQLLQDLPTYLKFAWDNFEQSYAIPNLEFEFLCLMTSLEAMFNSNKAELKCSIKKGVAVLIAKDKADALHVIASLKKLYELRVSLLNTGDKKGITGKAVVELKDIVRKALNRAIELRLSKDDLMKVLLESDFGKLPPIN